MPSTSNGVGKGMTLLQQYFSTCYIMVRLQVTPSYATIFFEPFNF